MFHRFCKYFIQLIFSPANGWEDFQRDWDEHSDWEGHTFSGVYRRCFLPIALVCALSAFFRLIYGVPGGWLEALQHAIITFVSLFLSSQFANYVLLTYMPRFLHTDHPAEYAPRWGMLVIVSLTLLGLIGVLENLVKVHVALFAFLPLYCVFIIWKGARFCGVSEQEVGMYMLLTILSIPGSYYLINFLLNALV